MNRQTASPVTNSTTFELPTPADRPEAHVVIFDGHCRFCRFQVARLNQLDWRHELSFLSLHDPEVYRRWPDLQHDQLMKEMVVIDKRGNRFAGACAIRWLSRHLIPLWLVAPFLHVPFTMPLWKWLYRQVAQRRYRFGKVDDCESGTCKVHWG